MRFWDSSALVPLLVAEEFTVPLRDLYLGEPGTIVWWGTPVECASAVSRLEREERLSPGATTEALERLDALAQHWHRIEPVDTILETARRLLRVHPLRAADSLQLAAAFLASEGGPRRSSSSAWTTGSRSQPSARASQCAAALVSLKTSPEREAGERNRRMTTFAMEERELQAVLKALRKGGIDIVAKLTGLTTLSVADLS